jgi:NitT/TauT family transport system ATP-binding protein
VEKSAIEHTAVQIQNLGISFTDENGQLTALDNVNFTVSSREFICILGPSGAGKSVLLRVLAGLLQPSVGSVQFGMENNIPRVGFVFQAANLMPWRTVLQNITLPLELQGVDPEIARKQALEWVDIVGLTGFENTWPGDLSGGMAKRVAIARAFIHDPDLLLLDEPFGALDSLTRERMGTELLNLWQVRQKTVIMVTHSISETLLLSDRILVLSARPGHICYELHNNLPRPRQEEIRYTPQFNDLARKLRSTIE